MSPSTIGPSAVVSKSSSEASYAISAAALKSGEVSYPSAASATTMVHVRTAIDDLDRQIVTLLG